MIPPSLSLIKAVVTVLLAVSTTQSQGPRNKKNVYWYIDGNNFLGQRGSKGLPRSSDDLLERLSPISTTAAKQIVVVFDGKKDRTERLDNLVPPASTDSGPGPGTDRVKIRQVLLEDGAIADDFIVQEIERLSGESKFNRIKLVTADKALRARALVNQQTKTVVNPKTFWQKYLPRMSGLKKRVEQEQQ